MLVMTDSGLIRAIDLSATRRGRDERFLIVVLVLKSDGETFLLDE